MTTGRAFRSLLTGLQPRLDEPVHRSVPYSLSYVQRPARASCLMPPPQGSATASAYSTSIGPGSRLRRGSCSVRHRQQEHRSPSWPRSERKTGQKGIISCITEAPDQTTYACGSYSKSIGCVLRGIIDRLIAISLFHSIPTPPTASTIIVRACLSRSSPCRPGSRSSPIRPTGARLHTADDALPLISITAQKLLVCGWPAVARDTGKPCRYIGHV